MLEDFDMSTPAGDYEVEHTVRVAPLIIDADGWPTEGPPGLLATAGGWIAQGMGATSAQMAPAQPAQMAPQTASIAISHAQSHAQTSTFSFIYIDQKTGLDLMFGSTFEIPVLSTHIPTLFYIFIDIGKS